jgi:hypothetical protein
MMMTTCLIGLFVICAVGVAGVDADALGEDVGVTPGLGDVDA